MRIDLIHQPQRPSYGAKVPTKKAHMYQKQNSLALFQVSTLVDNPQALY